MKENHTIFADAEKIISDEGKVLWVRCFSCRDFIPPTLFETECYANINKTNEENNNEVLNTICGLPSSK